MPASTAINILFVLKIKLLKKYILVKMSQYLGKINANDFSDKIVAEFLKVAQNRKKIPAFFFFYKEFKSTPCFFSYSGLLAYSSILKILQNEFKNESKNNIVEYNYCNQAKFKYQKSILAKLENGIMLFLSNGTLTKKFDFESKIKIDFTVDEYYHTFKEATIMFMPEQFDVADKLMKLFKLSEMKPITTATLKMVCKTKCGFYLMPIKIKKPIIDDIRLNYGDEFVKIHEIVLASLNQTSLHGLILLHGLPGTGKTHYIRYLIQEFAEKNLIYIPPDMTSLISSPEFFPFMLENKKSILIIEDAENIITSREGKSSTSQAISNLLNLSDGLLGDSLNQLVIATFNCELNSIDHALLRKGRLITQYGFGKLPIDRAQALSDSLGFNSKITESKVLSDIYNQKIEN